MRDIAMHETYEEQLAIEAYEAWRREERESSADGRAATAMDEEDSEET